MEATDDTKHTVINVTPGIFGVGRWTRWEALCPEGALMSLYNEIPLNLV